MKKFYYRWFAFKSETPHIISSLKLVAQGINHVDSDSAECCMSQRELHSLVEKWNLMAANMIGNKSGIVWNYIAL